MTNSILPSLKYSHLLLRKYLYQLFALRVLSLIPSPFCTLLTLDKR
jgi:hypothetical protein